MSAETNPDRDLAPPGVASRAVIIVTSALMAMMIAAVIGLSVFYVWWLPDRALPAPRPLPTPQVRTDERLLRQEIEAAQRARLTGYRWQDDQKTLIAIPIERAMQILAGRGAKAYDPIATSGTTAESVGADTAAGMQNPGLRVPSNKEPRGAQRGRRQP
jgi:hypothetical protein